MNEVMHPPQQTPIAQVSSTNDDVSNSGTVDKSDSSKTYGGKDKASKFSNDDASPKHRNLGMIDSLVGATYQQKLSIPVICRVATLIRKDKQLIFTVTNDDEEGGLFDDIVFKSDDGDLFIQAKHKEDKSYTITWDDLTSTDKNAPFAISKYFKCFLEKQWVGRKNPLALVLCTNIGLNEDVKTSVKEYPFGTNIVDSILKSITNDAYKIDLNILKDETKNKLLDYLKEDSELGSLAKLIAQHIFQKKNVDFRNDSVQTKYRSIIENEIAAKKSKGNECYEVNAWFFKKNEEFKRLFEHEYKLQQREQFIQNDIKEKGMKLAKAKPTEMADKNNLKRICNSDVADLATQLAKHIYHEKDIDFQITVLKKYRYFIEKCIATDNKNRKGCYVVDENNFTKVGGKDFKRLFDMEYQNLLNPEPLDIWEDVQKKGIRLKKAKQPNNSGKQELPKPIEDDQIKKFFKSFMIVCNTKHEEDQVVASILVGEVLPENIREQSFAAFTFNKVGMWILDKMKDKSRTPIQRRDVDELFMNIESSLNFSQLKALSNSNCNKLDNLGLQCKQDVLQKFKLYKNLHSLLAKVETNRNEEFTVDIDEYNYPSWIVPQIVKSVDFKLDFLFLEDTEFKPRKKQIMDAFGAMESPLILVVECKNVSNIKGYIEGWVEGKPTKTIKKIILIDQTYHVTEIEKDLLFRDLTDESREKVINQTKSIHFFGTETPISELILDEDKLNFALDIVLLSSEPRMKYNKLKAIYEKIKGMFIKRSWEQCDKNESFREISSQSFWSARKEGKTLTKLFPGSETVDKISYETFVDFNNQKFNGISLQRKSERRHAPGVEENTQDPVQSNSCDFDKTDPKVHVIFNEAGSGKSFYMTWLASSMHDRSPSWWIIKFSLNEYCMVFDQLQERNKCETIDGLIAIRFLFQLVYLSWFVDNMFLIESNNKFNKAQEIAEALNFSNGCLKLDKYKLETVSSEELILLRIFVHKFNSKQIVILMDGFDEIAPYYKTVVLNLLSMLTTLDGICKLYLSSRPYGLRKEVETALEDCACYRLVEFDQQDQLSFIDRYLLKHFDEYKSSDDTKQKRTSRVVFAIARKILGNLMEIPLFLSMGIELLMPMVKKYISVKEETISKQIIKDFENSFELLSMVESFVEKKLNILNIEKTGSTIASSKTVEAIDYAKQKSDQVKATHSLLALYTIMYRYDIEKLLTDDMQNTARQYMERVKIGSEKSGLIEGVIDYTPIFNHRIYADYFAALWFYKNQNVPGVKDFLKRKIYEIMGTIEISQFLDRMICRKNPLHMAVLGGSKDEMERILTENPSFITARDDWGRTPLQLSFLLPPAEAHRYIVEFLLHRVDEKSANIQDTYFKWFPLDYAYCADSVIPRSNLFRYGRPGWRCVLTLLNKGASIDTPEMLSRFSTEEHFMMFVDVLIIEFFTERNYTPNFERFFTKLVKILGSDKVLNLKIPIDTPYENFSDKDMGEKLGTKLNKIKLMGDFYSSIPVLEFCIIIDSVMFKIIIENFKLKRSNEYHFKLALKYRSINVLQYLITDHRQYLKVINDNFERELWELLAYLQNDELEFKYLFHEYCKRHNITCRENTPFHSEKWNRGFSSRQDLMELFPKKFEIRDDTNIDSGTELLIARALHLDNASAVKYLLYKLNTNLDNRFIRQIRLNCKIKWCCLSSYHFLLDNSIDLTDTDEKGKNLLQCAVCYGDSNLVKCLIEHYGFQPKDINTRENNWNAFFYCVSSCGWDDNNKNIFDHMLEKDPVDCFSQLDEKRKSVFYYAAKNDRRISDYIIQRKFENQLEDLHSDQIVDLIKLLKASGFNAKDVLEYLQNTHLNDETKCKLICNILESIEELRYHDKKGRNLLHIAIMEGRFIFGKCLIENFGFNCKEINKKENNWSAFFYCVSGYKYRYFEEHKKRFFLYMMEKDPIDCFEQRDSNQKNLFYYLYDFDENLAKQMLKTECEKLKHFSIELRVPALIGILQKSDICMEDILQYLEENHLVDENSVKIICDYLKTTGDLKYKSEETGRNLLHITCMEGWLTLAKYLIEHYAFDVKEMNEKQNNWNAFFYCVCSWKNAPNNLEIFIYLMKKDSFDCFRQLDSKNHNVFYYALSNNVPVADYIIQNELPANNSVSVKEWALMFSKRLSDSKLTRTNVNRFLSDWKQYSTLDAKHEIYIEIKSNLERMNGRRTTTRPNGVNYLNEFG